MIAIKMIAMIVMIGDDVGLGLGMREGRGGREKSATLAFKIRGAYCTPYLRKPMLGI